MNDSFFSKGLNGFEAKYTSNYPNNHIFNFGLPWSQAFGRFSIGKPFNFIIVIKLWLSAFYAEWWLRPCRTEKNHYFNSL